MGLRLAVPEDLPRLAAVYSGIARHMAEHGVPIWDEVYPGCCFPEDVDAKRLYVLAEGGDILSAFALCRPNGASEELRWTGRAEEALYLCRLGVSPDHMGQGIGGVMLRHAARLTRQAGKGYLRLLVVDCNAPAIRFYVKNGFHRVEGVHREVVDRDLTLREYGFETEVR